MILRNQPVRAILMWLIGLLGSLALLPASADLARSVESLRTAETIAAHNAVADFCLAAVKDFAFERGRTNVVLHDDTPISTGNRRFLDERRAGTDTALKAVLAAAPVAGSAPGEETAGVYALVGRLRDEVDRDFARPLAERDPTLAGRWVETASQLVLRLETLTLHITRLPGTDSAFDRMSAVRLITLRFRDVVGLESSTILALAAAKRPLDRKDTAGVYTLRGRSAE